MPKPKPLGFLTATTRMGTARRTNRSGRPGLASDAPRSLLVRVRLRPSELRRLREEARALSKSLPQLLGEAILRARVQAPRVPAVNLQSIGELVRWGNNLNQIAKALNSGRYPRDWRGTLEGLGAALAETRRLLRGR